MYAAEALYPVIGQIKFLLLTSANSLRYSFIYQFDADFLESVLQFVDCLAIHLFLYGQSHVVVLTDDFFCTNRLMPVTTLLMLKLLSSNALGFKDFWKFLNPVILRWYSLDSSR